MQFLESISRCCRSENRSRGAGMAGCVLPCDTPLKCFFYSFLCFHKISTILSARRFFLGTEFNTTWTKKLAQRLFAAAEWKGRWP